MQCRDLEQCHSDGVRRCVESDKCVMGARTQRSVLSVSTIEEKGYAVLFRDGQVLFMPRGSSSDTTVVLGVRESNLYRLKGQPMRAMANSSRVTVNREQVALKVVQTQREPDFRGSQQIQRESEGVSRLRGRVSCSEGVNLQVQVGERSLPRLSGRCHGLRRPGRKLRSRRLLGATCLPRRDHAIQQDLLR
jgi:hypothetical protein